MEPFDAEEVLLQGIYQAVWQYGHTGICTFAVADNDLAAGEIEVFDARGHILAAACHFQKGVCRSFGVSLAGS